MIGDVTLELADAGGWYVYQSFKRFTLYRVNFPNMTDVTFPSAYGVDPINIDHYSIFVLFCHSFYYIG